MPKWYNFNLLKKKLIDFLVAPEELISLNKNIEIKKLYFDYKDEEELDI